MRAQFKEAWHLSIPDKGGVAFVSVTLSEEVLILAYLQCWDSNTDPAVPILLRQF